MEFALFLLITAKTKPLTNYFICARQKLYLNMAPVQGNFHYKLINQALVSPLPKGSPALSPVL